MKPRLTTLARHAARVLACGLALLITPVMLLAAILFWLVFDDDPLDARLGGLRVGVVPGEGPDDDQGDDHDAVFWPVPCLGRPSKGDPNLN